MFGAPSGASTCPIRSQSGLEPSSVRFATPVKEGIRIGSLLRSGWLIIYLRTSDRLGRVQDSAHRTSLGLPAHHPNGVNLRQCVTLVLTSLRSDSLTGPFFSRVASAFRKSSASVSTSERF